MLETRREIQLLGLLYDLRGDPWYVKAPTANTRLADKIVFSVERVNYEIYRRSPFYVGQKLWSNLDREIQKSGSKSQFKLRVKSLYD